MNERMEERPSVDQPLYFLPKSRQDARFDDAHCVGTHAEEATAWRQMKRSARWEKLAELHVIGCTAWVSATTSRKAS